MANQEFSLGTLPLVDECLLQLMTPLITLGHSRDVLYLNDPVYVGDFLDDTYPLYIRNPSKHSVFGKLLREKGIQTPLYTSPLLKGAFQALRADTTIPELQMIRIDLLRTHISQLEPLSVRTANILAYILNNETFLANVVQLTVDDLLETRGCGKGVFNELTTIMQRLGLSLGMQLTDEIKGNLRSLRR